VVVNSQKLGIDAYVIFLIHLCGGEPPYTSCPLDKQKLDYAKLMVNENYTNKKIMAISGAGPSAIIR
jgi:hypothetical protein